MRIITEGKHHIQPGTKFGRWTTLGEVFFVPISQSGRRLFVVVECQCGTVSCVRAYHLESGLTIGCGCLRATANESRCTTHGKSKRGSTHALYGVYEGMKNRCGNPRVPAYKTYGARGVRVCDLWMADFMEFYQWSISNGWMPGLTIDRIDNDGNYEPSNCRFLTRSQNSKKRWEEYRASHQGHV